MNLTVTINEDVLRRARIRALEQNTSVNALVREFLETYAGADDRQQAMQEILKLARRSRGHRASVGSEGRGWTREDIYEDRLGRYNPR